MNASKTVRIKIKVNKMAMMMMIFEMPFIIIGALILVGILPGGFNLAMAIFIFMPIINGIYVVKKVRYVKCGECGRTYTFGVGGKCMCDSCNIEYIRIMPGRA